MRIIQKIIFFSVFLACFPLRAQVAPQDTVSVSDTLVVQDSLIVTGGPADSLVRAGIIRDTLMGKPAQRLLPFDASPHKKPQITLNRVETLKIPSFFLDSLPTTFEDNRIVLVHPTVDNLKHFLYLTGKRIIDLKSFEILGVFYEKENYDYRLTNQFLVEQGLENVRLYQVSGDLTKDKLFGKNACSQQFHKLFKCSEAMLFWGGPDIPPAVYGEKTSLLTSVTDPYRHYFELSLMFHMFGGYQDVEYKPFLEENKNYVVRGFCLGMQSMNVATGGSLVQDIPSAIYNIRYVEDVYRLESDRIHSSYYPLSEDLEELYPGHFHPIKLSRWGYFVKRLKMNHRSTYMVNSRHHQSVKKTGKDLRVAATSLDGKVIEAIAHKKYKNVLGVQFHPEDSRLYQKEGAFKLKPTDSETQSLVDILKKGNGYKFHLEFWKDFSRTMGY